MVLQRFIPPATAQAETIRVRWTPHTTVMHRCLNRHLLHDHQLDGGGVDLSTRMATSHWDCSDSDMHAVTVQPLGVAPDQMPRTSDGTLIYGNGSMSKIQKHDNRLASKCLEVAQWIGRHVRSFSLSLSLRWFGATTTPPARDHLY